MLPLNTIDMPGERPAGALPVVEILQRHAEVAAACVARVEHHDPIGLVEGQPPQQNAR